MIGRKIYFGLYSNSKVVAMNSKVQFIIIGVCLYLFSVIGYAQICVDSIKPTAPAYRFNNNGDGTVTDLWTGLMWKKCSEGLVFNVATDTCGGAVGTYDWSTALQRAENSTELGYSDWRLPNIKELQSIVELSCREPAIDITVFPTESWSYWSSTAYYFPGLSAWHLSYFLGGVSTNSKTSPTYVRLVRGN